MSKHLITYKNCSKGGVSSVIRGRALAEPESHYDAVFELDKGGRFAYSDLPNVSCRVVGAAKFISYVNYALNRFSYDEVCVLSNPDAANRLEVPDRTLLTYEIHSSHFTVVEKELAKLELPKVDIFRVPSEFSAFNVQSMLPRRYARRVEVTPNMINNSEFTPDGQAEHFPSGMRPLMWVGRFDKGKGPKYLARVLAKLPDEFHAFMIISLETLPGPASDFLSEARALGVEHRIHFRMNLPQSKVASMFRGAARCGGAFISTSLQESFGYALAEAEHCALPIYAFDLPVLPEVVSENAVIVDPGDVEALAIALRGSAESGASTDGRQP